MSMMKSKHGTMELEWKWNKQMLLVKDSSTNKPHRNKLWLLVHFYELFFVEDLLRGCF